MEARNRIGVERFYDRYPEYNGAGRCSWKSIAESEGVVVEGRLKDCSRCSGVKYQCNTYNGRRQ